jgi:periplasmic protein TonB
MFEDFQVHSNSKGTRRFGGSVALAAILYGVASAMVIGATATAGRTVEEELTQVEFAPVAPKPEPPPPVAPAAALSPRPKTDRKRIDTPKEIPKEKPRESDQPLQSDAPSGPVGGFLDGVRGGTGAAAVAPTKPVPAVQGDRVIPPVALSSNRAPTYTPRARRLGLEGLVVVTFEVDTSGAVVSPRVVSGPPELGEIVLRVVATWRFRPATRNGAPIRFRKTVPVRFRLEEG